MSINLVSGTGWSQQARRCFCSYHWEVFAKAFAMGNGVVLIFAPLLVYLQLMPFTSWSLASERYVFVPVAGLALVLIDLLGRMRKTRN